MTIAQQLKIKDFPFIIKDKNGKEIYYESSKGYWQKKEYDSNGNIIYYETSDGYWIKNEYDSNGNIIHWKNSNGVIINNRPKIVEMTLEDIAKKMGISIEQLRIKD